MLFVRPIARFVSRLSVHEDNMTLNAAAWSSKHASVPCQSLVASHHIVGASTISMTIGIQMNHAAPAYSPLTTL